MKIGKFLDIFYRSRYQMYLTDWTEVVKEKSKNQNDARTLDLRN